MNLTALHPFLLTKKDANDFIIILEKIIESLFSTPKGRDLTSAKKDFNITSSISNTTSYDLKTAIEKIIKESNVDITNKLEQETFLRKLKDEIISLPVIHIILAFLPKKEIISIIQSWFYQNYKKTVLLDISADDSIIAGMIISFKGRANDYSIKNKVDQMI